MIEQWNACPSCSLPDHGDSDCETAVQRIDRVEAERDRLRGVVRSVLTAFHVEHSRGQSMGVERIEDCQHMVCKAATPFAS